jgi:hypothetical protein
MLAIESYGNMQAESSKLKADKIVKSRFKDWIPAIAGMTSVVSV